MDMFQISLQLYISRYYRGVEKNHFIAFRSSDGIQKSQGKGVQDITNLSFRLLAFVSVLKSQKE